VSSFSIHKRYHVDTCNALQFGACLFCSRKFHNRLVLYRVTMT